MNESELEQLVEQFGSNDNTVTIPAANRLRESGHLYDGSLRGKSLRGANLYEVYIEKADLAETDFSEATLHGADLTEANAQRTKFTAADMVYVRMDEIDAEGAIFNDADIRGGFVAGNLRSASFQSALLENAIIGGDWRFTSLQKASLENSKLIGMDLRGANLSDANLRGAFLENVVFDEQTILPDGTNWTPATNMARFTTDPT